MRQSYGEINMNENIIEGRNEYDSKKVYTLYVNPKNRHITGMVGFTVGVQELNDGNNFLYFNIKDLTKEEYIEISRSINSNEAMTFLSEEDDRTVISRRILIDLLDDTMVDAKTGMIFGFNNIIKFKARVVDRNLKEVKDVSTIEIKNIKKNNPMSLNNNEPERHKIFVDNPSVVTCELLGEGVHTVKIKVQIPEVDYLWLTAYPQLMKHTEEELESIKKWLLENAGQPA
jgi:hypothetical protein